jgi:hypothetical protein
VVLAGDGFAVEPTGGEGDAAVGAEVAEGEEFAGGFSSEEQRHAEEHGLCCLAFAQMGCPKSGVPVAEDEFGWRA